MAFSIKSINEFRENINCVYVSIKNNKDIDINILLLNLEKK